MTEMKLRVTFVRRNTIYQLLVDTPERTVTRNGATYTTVQEPA